MNRGVITVLIVLAGLCAGALPASAATWTAVNSGTTSQITAIEYQSPTRFWFTTANGEIFTRQPDGSFLRTYGPTGLPLNDIEFQTGGGAVGLAVGNGGQVVRSTNSGANWTTVSGIPVSKSGTTFPDCSATQPLANVNSVRFASNLRVWIFAQGSQIARSSAVDSANVGAGGTWVDANRAGDNSCKVASSYGDGYADAFFVPANPDVGYIVADSFSEIFLTTNNLATAAQKLPSAAGNAGSSTRVLAGDPSNPNRMWSTAHEPYGRSTTAYTEDGWATSDWWQLGNPSKRAFTESGPADVAFSGGTVLAAGDAGMILNSTDGKTFYYVDAPAFPTANWRAVGLADAKNAAVGGAGGALILSSDADVTPDVVAPTVSIAGPATATAGSGLTYTATAADTGGSGVDPAGYTWTVTGGVASPSTGASQDLTFPAAGQYTVSVTARDGAGNVSQPATTTVTVQAAPTTAPPVPTTLPAFSAPKKAPVTGGAARRKGRFVVFAVKGKLGIPRGVSAQKACAGSLTIQVLKGKKKLASSKVRLSRSCGYAKTIKLPRSKVGSAKRLTLKLSFPGNSAVRKLVASYTVKVK